MGRGFPEWRHRKKQKEWFGWRGEDPVGPMQGLTAFPSLQPPWGSPSWMAPAACLVAKRINPTLLTTYTCLLRSSQLRCEQACPQVV